MGPTRSVPMILLAACASPPPPAGGTPGPTSPTPECGVSQELGSGGLGAVWRSDTGTLYAVGATRQPRVRASDGAWTLDPVVEGIERAIGIDGASDDSVWAFSANQVWRRDGGGWHDAGLSDDGYDLEAIAVVADDHVVVLQSEDHSAEYTSRSAPVLWTWNGLAWSDERFPTLDGSVRDLAILADGTIVLAASQGLHVLAAGLATPLAGPGGDRLVVADDGVTLVVVGQTVGIGDVAGGVVENDPALYDAEWSDAWATGPDDVWIAGTWWLGGPSTGIVAHWDGATWTEVVSDASDSLQAITGGGGETFALGGVQHELVLVGDATGMTVDREVWSVDGLTSITVDPETGAPYGIGYGPSLAVWDGEWTAIPLDDPLARPYRVAASSGRALVVDLGEARHVWDGAAWTTTIDTEVYWHATAAAGGALFAVGQPVGDEGPGGAAVGIRDVGAGWEDLDMTGFPAGAEAIGAYAEGPDALWVGVSLGGGGALVYWDGTSWTVPVPNLPETPEWIRRMDDGLLYFAVPEGAGEGADPVWQWDGANAAPVADFPPDVRLAHRTADGTWYASAIAATNDGFQGILQVRPPGGAWAELLSADSLVPMAADGETVWAATESTAWTLSGCP